MPIERDPRRRTPAGGVKATSTEDADTIHLGRAVRDTQQTVRGAADRVEVLRQELGERVDKLDGKVDGLEISVARMDGKVDILLDEFAVARNERSQIRVSAVQAVIDVEKTGQIAKVQEDVAVRADRRQLALKVLAFVGPIAAAAVSWMISRC